MMPEFVTTFDHWLLPYFHGSGSMFVDQLAIALTYGPTWVALYVALVVLVVKNNEKFSQIMFVVTGVALALVFSDGMADFIVKPLVARPRPVLDPAAGYFVSRINDYIPEGYSFFSAHAANTFALSVFFCLLVRNSMFSCFLISWAVLNCWTRLYLGVHFPSDIIVGVLWGIVSGIAAFMIYKKLYFKVTPHLHYISTKYTPTGYSLSDIDAVLTVLVLTVTVCIIVCCVTAF